MPFHMPTTSSSAGNTRGLIEAGWGNEGYQAAASLKQEHFPQSRRAPSGLPRGIPAASLKRWVVEPSLSAAPTSSAGNTRGLIEAVANCNGYPVDRVCLPRGIPAASLKLQSVLDVGEAHEESSAGNTRGLIEAMYGAG